MTPPPRPGLFYSLISKFFITCRPFLGSVSDDWWGRVRWPRPMRPQGGRGGPTAYLAAPSGRLTKFRLSTFSVLHYALLGLPFPPAAACPRSVSVRHCSRAPVRVAKRCFTPCRTHFHSVFSRCVMNADQSLLTCSGKVFCFGDG